MMVEIKVDKKECSFLKLLNEVIERLGDLTVEGKNYWLGYSKAFLDAGIISEKENKIIGHLICHKVNHPPKELTK